MLLFTFILSLHWDGVLSYPSSDRALDTRSYMAGPGALPENTVPATSSCCIRASVSLSLPHTAISAFVSDGVHDIPRHAVKLLEEDEAAVRPAAPEPTFRGEKRFGVEGLEWYWLLSLRSSDSGEGTSVFGIFNGVEISGECSAVLDAAMLPLLLRGGGRRRRAGALRTTTYVRRLTSGDFTYGDFTHDGFTHDDFTYGDFTYARRRAGRGGAEHRRILEERD